jgi:putative PEP-CTERM system histidine kinase
VTPNLPDLILWLQALAALLFGAVAITLARQPSPPRTLVVALGASALAALAVAGLGAHDTGTGLATVLRDGAWVAALLIGIRRHRSGSRGVLALAISVVGTLLVVLMVDLVATLPVAAGAQAVLFAVAIALRMLALAGGLLLVVHAMRAGAAGATRTAAGLHGLTLLWASDLALAAAAWASGDWSPGLIAVRSAVSLAAAALIGAAVLHRRDTPMQPSRTVMWRLIAAAGLAAYTGLVLVASSFAAALGGAQGRIVQTAVVVGGAAALLGLVSTPQLRAWARVKLAKHLFGHRYDYRLEWQRFTDGLAGDAPLPERVVRAMAAFTDSPAGLLCLMTPDGPRLEAVWQWLDAPAVEGGIGAAALLSGGWMIELDAVRDGTGQDDAAGLSQALLACFDAWIVVPLIHEDQLIAAVILARPPISRRLDWEDRDLLRVAGRQAASHLAEDRARAALVEVRRFDEFNRRFAFIMHDLKNLASQMTLTASNARRHADNPAFRADMVATLGDCADRMAALIARLSSHGEQPAETLGPVDALAAARRVVARFPQHPVKATGTSPLVLAHAQRLEQVLGHLVQNAVEASAPDVPVTVTVSEVDGRAVVDIVDRGIGMSAGFIRDQLFQPFASSKAGGFGLGAFEARQLVAAMGGSLAVESRAGEGTRFRIHLPLAATLEAAA